MSEEISTNWVSKARNGNGLIWKIAEVALVILALGYSTYVNASRVPDLQASIAKLTIDVEVIKAQLTDIKDALKSRRIYARTEEENVR